MKPLIAITVAALLGLVGLGLIAAQDGDSVHVETERGFCTESGPGANGAECREILGQ